MNKIKELPTYDRPREKALRYGINTLSTEELLALLIGFGGKDNSALDIAKNLLEDSRGLYNLVNKTAAEFKQYKGISDAKALILCAIFELVKRYQEKEMEQVEGEVDNAFLYRKYAPRLTNQNEETLILVILDKRKKITHEITLYKGGNNKLSLSYYDIFKRIMNHEGYYFYVIHNHPNNEITPSKSDTIFTAELTRRCDKMDIVLMDHLIITDKGFYSFLTDRFYEKEKDF